MSATDFAVYLEQRIVELGLCKSEVRGVPVFRGKRGIVLQRRMCKI